MGKIVDHYTVYYVNRTDEVVNFIYNWEFKYTVIYNPISQTEYQDYERKGKPTLPLQTSLNYYWILHNNSLQWQIYRTSRFFFNLILSRVRHDE